MDRGSNLRSLASVESGNKIFVRASQTTYFLARAEKRNNNFIGKPVLFQKRSKMAPGAKHALAPALIAAPDIPRTRLAADRPYRYGKFHS